MIIRRERPEDIEAIHEVHRQAFAGDEPAEAGLVRDLRADRGWRPELSLVAEGDGGRVVGHVVVTEGAVGDVPAGGLGPIGVLPDQQGRQVGHALMHAVIAAADALGYPVVVLLGHLDYYPRFGFVPASTLGITPPDPGWGAHFQARPLAGYRPDVRGPFRFAEPFDRL